jgi:menaquinone-dependent protoporphyrinogen IX oxidase
MQDLIVYAGKYGATRQYAEWLGQELGLPVLTPDKINNEKLVMSNLLLLGSSVYIGKLVIHAWLKQNVNYLRNKNVFLFIVCASSDPKEHETIIKNNLPVSLKNNCRIFFLPGKVIREKLSWKDRLLLKLGSAAEKDPAKKKEMQQDFDNVKKENLAEMLKAIHAFEKDELHQLDRTC